MTGVDRGAAAATALLGAAGPDMYRDNPFRVTGLPTTATTREIRQRRQRDLTALSVRGREPGAERAAFDALGTANGRLAAELLWLWGEDTTECGCPARAHETHDAAVRVHANAIDADAENNRSLRLWTAAADAWAAALTGDSDAVWRHMRHRVDTLGDRGLDGTSVDGLRDALPKALLAPQVALAVRRSTSAARTIDAWPFPSDVLDHARRTAAESELSDIRDLVSRAGTAVDDGRVGPLAAQLRTRMPVAMLRLEHYLPHQRFRESAALRNQAAVALNNAGLAVALEPPRFAVHSARLLEHAHELASDDETLAVIERNVALHGQSIGRPSVMGGAVLLLSFDAAAYLLFRATDWWPFLIGALICLVGLPMKVFTRSVGWKPGSGGVTLAVGIAGAGLVVGSFGFDPLDVLWCLAAFWASQPLARMAADALLEARDARKPQEVG